MGGSRKAGAASDAVPSRAEKLADIANMQSAEASDTIEGIITTNTRIRQLVDEKSQKSRNEEEIAGYLGVLP